MIGNDPIFLQAIEFLKTAKPFTYDYREIDLYNDGVDASQQEIKVIGNVLQVLDFPEYYEVYIQFNEPENSFIRIKKGIYLLTFYRFFLTFRHSGDRTNIYGVPFLLKLLLGKDLIVAEYPTPVEKSSLELVPGEIFSVLHGAGRYVLACKHVYCQATYFFFTKNFNQIRGVVSSSATTEKKLYIVQYITDDLKWEDEVIIPASKVANPFFIDLVSPKFKFEVTKDGSLDYNLYFYAKAWCY